MSRPTFSHLTYGVTLAPVKLVRADHTIIAPTPAIAAVEMRHGDPVVRVLMASNLDTEHTRQLATAYVERWAQQVALFVSSYEPPNVSLSWAGAAGQSGRSVFGSGSVVGTSKLTATLAPSPAQDAAFMRYVSGGSLPPWAEELARQLAESTKVGGAAGYVMLFEAVKHAAAAVLGTKATEKTADDWLLKIEPSSPETPKPSNPSKTETEFSRIRAEMAHHKDRGVEPAEAAAQAARALPRLTQLVAKALRAELGILVIADLGLRVGEPPRRT